MDENAADGRIADVEREAKAAVEPVQPGKRKQQLHERGDDDRARVDVQLPVGGVGARNADHDARDDHEVPEHGRQGRDAELLVAVEDPDDDTE